MGCSIRGRLWSYLVAEDISQWVRWCQRVGAKLLDGSITIEKINDWFVVPIELTERPQLVAIGADWHDSMFIELERKTYIRVSNRDCRIFDVEISVAITSIDEPIRTRVSVDDVAAEFEVQFCWHELRFDRVSGAVGQMRIGAKVLDLA